MGKASTSVSLKRSQMAAPRGPTVVHIVVAAALVLLPATAAPQSSASRPLSQDANGPERAGPAVEFTVLARKRFPRPAMDASLQPIIKYQLANAFDTAIRALRTEPECRTLFKRLGSDGEDVLARSQYSDAGNSGYCEEAVAAFTNVGSMQIKLCRSFGELQASNAAALLLHEALHSSGLRESPVYPNAMTTREINVAVSQGCKLR
jgi:hypothetical protein